GTRKQGVYGLNATVPPGPGGATVKRIEWDRVILVHNGRDEVLQLEKPTGVAAAAGRGGAAAVASASAGGTGGGAAGGAGGAAGAGGTIQQVAENEYIVPRAEVDNAMENMSQLFTQIRAVPHFEGGQSVGFRLFAIRRGSLFDRIGLKNGDIIRSINGNEMTDPGKALALMQEL